MAFRDFYVSSTVADSAVLAMRLFPCTKSLADWSTYKVAPTESASPNAGRYVFRVNDEYGLRWGMFPSDSAPSDWSTATLTDLPPLADGATIKEKYAIKDRFAGPLNTLLSDWAPFINTTGSRWAKRVGVNMRLDGDSATPSVGLEVDDFSQLGTLYAIDAGCESYILRVRARVTEAQYGRIYFRTDATNRGYSILWTQHGSSTWFRLSKYDGTTTTTVLDLSGANAPTLTSNQYYWIQIRVNGPRVRAFVEGWPTRAIDTTMNSNFNATFIGIGGPRASTRIAEVELQPLDGAAEIDGVLDRLTLLEASVDLLAAGVPAAIAPETADIISHVTSRTLAAADYVTDADLAARTLIASEYAKEATLTARTLAAADYLTEAEHTARSLPAAQYATADAVDNIDLSAITTVLDTIQSTLSQLGPVPIWIRPVSPSGEIIDPIIIGDDYLAVNNRDFSWLVPAVTGVDPATAVFRFGGNRIIRPGNGWLVTGTVTAVDASTWRVSADLPKAATESLAEGPYRWTGEIVSSSGTEITRLSSGGTPVQLVRKQT